MKFTLHKAQKIAKPLKMFIYGPTFSGKTNSSLLLANGMVQQIRNCTEEEAYEHIVLIDTEYGRGALYNKIGSYNYFRIDAPYNTEKLVDVINQINPLTEIDVIIIDSLSHFWVKKGGILDQKNEADKKGGNSYSNWQTFTANFNDMVDVLMQSPKHMIITARAKSDTVLCENAQGKMAPKTFGLKPEIRDNFEYECDITFNLDKNTHELLTEKCIPGMKPTYDMATPETGKEILKIHMADAIIPQRTIEEVAESIRHISASNQSLIKFVQLRVSGRKLEEIPYDELITVEKELIGEVKKQQINKH